VRSAISLACLVVAAVVLLLGLGLCLWGAYLWLAALLGAAGAAAVIGVATLILAGGLVWTAIHISR
jgi:hypothetical protein